MKYEKALLIGCVAVGLAAGVTGTASAEPQGRSQAQSTPDNFPWTFDKKGNRVPKSQVVRGEDGTTREEVRRGNCVTIKERTPDGGVKSVTRC